MAFHKRLSALLLALLVLVPAAQAQPVDEKPNAFAMVGDLVVARPIGLVMTAVGAAAFVVSLPFTALAGHVGESAETLVLGPGEAVFMRCLGCREAGYTYKDKELREARGQND
ncbi:MAG TPA: hypothetical protein VJ947_07300 [Pseudohaliea sp.]|nr:hypothetical protein [Pseudohaliea sp.]